jgi:hypothetical protein
VNRFNNQDHIHRQFLSLKYIAILGSKMLPIILKKDKKTEKRQTNQYKLSNSTKREKVVKKNGKTLFYEKKPVFSPKTTFYSKINNKIYEKNPDF